MASNSRRRSGSSGRSPSRRQVQIGARSHGERASGSVPRPEVASDRKRTGAAEAKRLDRERKARAARLRARVRVGGAALLVAAVATGLVALGRSDLLPVVRVEVEGVARLKAEEVVEWADVPADATLIRFPGRAVEERVESHPWVLDASVRRDLPDGLVIRVSERVPAAILDDGHETLWVMDRGGFVMGERTIEDTANLPVIRDVEGLTVSAGVVASSAALFNALAVMEGLSTELRDRVRAVSAPTVEKTALYTVDDVEVFVGAAEDIATKDVLIRRILQEQAGRVVYINVRSVQRPTWRGLDDR